MNNAGIMIGGTIQLMALSLSGWSGSFPLNKRRRGTPLISTPSRPDAAAPQERALNFGADKSERLSMREQD
jgi:hypothetical protein